MVEADRLFSSLLKGLIHLFSAASTTHSLESEDLVRLVRTKLAQTRKTKLETPRSTAPRNRQDSSSTSTALPFMAMKSTTARCRAAPAKVTETSLALMRMTRRCGTCLAIWRIRSHHWSIDQMPPSRGHLALIHSRRAKATAEAPSSLVTWLSSTSPRSRSSHNLPMRIETDTK